MKKYLISFLIGIAFLIQSNNLATDDIKKYKVLVIMSYEESYHWCNEITEGINKIFDDSYETKFFFLNTKKKPELGKKKAMEGFNLYKTFKPDGIIACDDAAQSLFVVDYLKNKVNTPVIFCGVNEDPEKYGYPAKNVTGILERAHIKESIVLLNQIIPDLKKIGFILRNDKTTAKGVIKQITKEKDTYPVKYTEIKLANKMSDAINIVKDLKKTCDILFISNLEGLNDEKGNPLQEKQIIPVLVKTFGKPTITDDFYRVKYGVLCSVIKTGQEQGTIAAEMLLKIFNGTPLSEINIIRNQYGKKLVNVDTLTDLNINTKHILIRGIEWIKTE